FSTAAPRSVLYTLSLHDALPILNVDRGLLYLFPETHDWVVENVEFRNARGSGHAGAVFSNNAGVPRAAGVAELHVLYHPVVGLRSEEHTSELQSRSDLVCRLLLE